MLCSSDSCCCVDSCIVMGFCVCCAVGLLFVYSCVVIGCRVVYCVVIVVVVLFVFNECPYLLSSWSRFVPCLICSYSVTQLCVSG